LEEAQVSIAPRRSLIAVLAVVVLVAGAAAGRHLLGRTTSASSTAAPSLSGVHGSGAVARAPSSAPNAPNAGQGLSAAPTLGSRSGVSATGPSSTPANGGALPPVPVFPIAPQIVRAATIDLRVGKNTLSSALTNIAGLAAADGGYVESSSIAGGTARSSPVSGGIVFHVLDADFSDAMTTLSGYGKVTNQQIQGKDVTDQVAANAGSIQILQDEVNLLQGKLAQATDINTFLQIQDQLFPVEQQLQQLQNQQATLENSAALATITANLSAPGAPLTPAPQANPNANSATVAWRYLRHNSLAVLDGLAVGGAWALPVLVLLGLVWLAGTRIVRRRRQAVSPA
jgi:hypothetical protein